MLSRALRLTATRSVLVGNSAHGLHPVSAQGFNLGMRDVAAIVDCIADARGETGACDPGDAGLLRQYGGTVRNKQLLVGHTATSVGTYEMSGGANYWSNSWTIGAVGRGLIATTPATNARPSSRLRSITGLLSVNTRQASAANP